MANQSLNTKVTGIECPACACRESWVTDSRALTKDSNIMKELNYNVAKYFRSGIRRRRECYVCKHRWTTFEVGIDVVHEFERNSRSTQRIWECRKCGHSVDIKCGCGE